MANMAQAIRLALHYGETQLGVKDIFGEDVGPPLGGVFTATQGLETAWNTPLDERGIVGMAAGIAMTGDRCVAEIQFVDYIFNTIDLLKMVGNTYWCTNGQVNLPLVLMTPVGAGIRGSVYHSHSFEAWASRIQGWKIVMPSTPYEAYGLLISAIEDPNPVMFLKPKSLLRVRGEELIPGEPIEKELRLGIDAPVGVARKKWKPKWPDVERVAIPIGEGRVKHPGKDITIVTYGRMVLSSLNVAKKLSSEGIGVEVVDLRSIYPYDWQMIKESVHKTGRVVFVNEETDVTNFAEHLVYRCNQELFYDLLSRPQVVAGKNVPGVGLHNNLEEATIPGEIEIEKAVRESVTEVP